MPMRPEGRHVEAGAVLADLSAEQLNAVIDVARAVMDAKAGGGLSIDLTGGILNVVGQVDRKGFFARIDAEGTTGTAPNKYGYYAWTEVLMRPDGTFAVPADCIPRVGTLTGTRPDPARDLFFKSAVPVGCPVYMMPVTTGIGGETANWIFLTPDLVQVVRFGSGPRNPDGDYDGYVQRIDATTNQFVDAEQIWITIP